jgi:hypothetical protein
VLDGGSGDLLREREIGSCVRVRDGKNENDESFVVVLGVYGVDGSDGLALGGEVIVVLVDDDVARSDIWGR